MKRRNLFAATTALLVLAGTAQAQWSMNGSKIFYSDGKVGIGTNNPNSPLQVVSNIGAADRPTLLVKMTNTNPQSGNAAIRGINRGTSIHGIGVWGSHDGEGFGVFGSADGDEGIGVYGEANGANGIAVYGSAFGLNAYGGFFIGDVYCQDSVGIGVVVPQFRLHLSSDSAAKPTSNTWTISSDRRLKKNIDTIHGALGKLMALRGVTYQWKNPETQGDMAGTYTGMIAQDVEKMFPEWVREDANGYKTLTVIGFEGIVVEAVRELRAEKDAEIAELREVINEMRAEIDALKAERGRTIAAGGYASSLIVDCTSLLGFLFFKPDTELWRGAEFGVRLRSAHAGGAKHNSQ
jgi:hypothetical protein